MPTITLDDVTWHYAKARPIFESATLTMATDGTRGRVYVVMGPSGCGKTTLLRLISGVLRPQIGNVLLDPRRMRTSYLGQEAVLFEHLSPEENARYYSRVSALARDFDEATFRETSARLELSQIFSSPRTIATLSGGERQRLTLLRALSIRPQLLLLDEPCTGLDLPVRMEFLSRLRREIDDVGALAIYVTHHVDEAIMIGDDIVYLSGRAGATSKITSETSSTFRQMPPGLDAARMISLGPLNVLECTVANGELRTRTIGATGRLGTVAAPAGDYAAAFGPEAACWTEQERGVASRIVGASSQYSFVEIDGAAGTLVAPIPVAGRSRLGLNGSVMLFQSVHDRPKTFLVSP